MSESSESIGGGKTSDILFYRCEVFFLRIGTGCLGTGAAVVSAGVIVKFTFEAYLTV
jgi:hypothetical protein